VSVSPSGRRLIAFRLDQIPEHVRVRAMEKLLRGADRTLPTVTSYSDKIALGVAVAQPSQRVYWIPRDAWKRVMEKPPRKRRQR
jgi:hypothetical protein